MSSLNDPRHVGAKKGRGFMTVSLMAARQVGLIGLALLGMCLFATQAQASFGVVPGSYSVTQSSLQAGGHPDLVVAFAFNLQGTPPDELPDENAKTIEVRLPAGVVGNPQAVAACSAAFLSTSGFCPDATQVGVLTYTLGGIPFTPTFVGVHTPVYNMVPEGDHPAELAFVNYVGGLVKVPILTNVGPAADYRVTSTVPQISTNLKVFEASLALWGNPSDPSHDGERGVTIGGGCLGLFGPSGNLCPSGLPAKAFLSNPTQCDVPGTTDFTAESWQHPGAFLPELVSAPTVMTGCDALRFEPTITSQPTSRMPGVPAGYSVALRIPQNDDSGDLATPHLKKAVVTMPEGVRISPSAADGLQGCSDEQIGLTSNSDVSCPEGSKIGSVVVKTPLLADPLEGSVYQGTQTSSQLVRLFIVVKGPGVIVKLPGSVDLNPGSGRITATFDNSPQLPFESFELRFKGGPRAPLSNPRTCGTKTTEATLTSYAGNVVHTTDSFEVTRDGNGAPCPPAGFAPTFEAGTLNPVAGKSTSLVVHFARTDDDAELSSLDMSSPGGLVGRIASVDLCGELQAAAGTCGDASRVGTVTTGAGAGPQPFFLGGRVYLTGPYKGQPFGLSIVVPAKAGPLDLGNVIVRASIEVRNDGSLRVISDPLPQILQGIPLQVRDVRVAIDRENFIVNPTNCTPTEIKGRISSAEGQVTDVSSRFQVGECGALPFKPRISLRLGRKGHTRQGNSTPLTAVVRQSPGQAGIKSTKVLLPLAVNALLPVVEKACTMAEFQAKDCEKARAGSAVAVTPLLRDPLKGSAYFVKTAKKGTLPNLIVALRGQVDIDLVGKITIPDSGQLATNFAAVPDVPIKSFKLSLVDGKQGPIGVAENLCKPKSRAQKAKVTFRGQNGKVVKRSQRMTILGCPKK